MWNIIIFIFLALGSGCSSALVGNRTNRGRRNRDKVREGTIRLVGGRNSYEGNVEIFHLGIWGSVCDDEFDIGESNIVCKGLGFKKAIKTTHNGEFGRGRSKIWMDNLYCEGHEKRLQDCRFDGWGIHDCAPSEAAGVVCESPKNATFENLLSKRSSIVRPRFKIQKESNVTVRLMGGRNPNEGRVEVRMGVDGPWGLICGDGWSLLEAAVICKQLNKGYGAAAVQSSYFGGSHENIVISGVSCTGLESNLTECVYQSFGINISCPGYDENIAGVICATELPDLVPDEVEIERSAYLEDRQLLFLQCAMEENCLASDAYKLDKNDYGWLYEQRRLLRFTARIGNIGLIDFRPFLPKHAWQWHLCHLHYHSMEVFAHFDIINSQGEKVAEGHKASFCLEDNNCLPGVEKKFACANYGDQGISVGCSDTYLHSVDCQWIDITHLKPGIYNFKVSINPEFKVAEISYENNAAVCTLYYNAISARVFNCTLQRP